MPRNAWFPKPATFGYITWACTPSWSIMASRAGICDEASCTSSTGIFIQPTPYILAPSRPMTLEAPVPPRSMSSPTTHRMRPLTSCWRGTRSRYRAGARDVHRSAGSDRWVSTSMILMPARTSPAGVVSVAMCSSIPRPSLALN